MPELPAADDPALRVLGALDFMLGDWRIAGVMHGEPVTGHAEVRRPAGAAFLEYRETVLDAQGQPAWQDLCVYTLDREQQQIEVHHFTAPAEHLARQVLPLDDGSGFHWAHRFGLGPIVRILRGPPWRLEVWPLDAAAPEVALTFLPAGR